MRYEKKNDFVLIYFSKQLLIFDEKSNVVAIFPDHGSRYMSKIYSDQWMNEQGFFDNDHIKNPKKIEYIK